MTHSSTAHTHSILIKACIKMNASKLRELETCAERIHEQMYLVQDAMSTAIINDPNNADHITDTYQYCLDYLNNKMKEKVSVFKIYTIG